MKGLFLPKLKLIQDNSKLLVMTVGPSLTQRNQNSTVIKKPPLLGIFFSHYKPYFTRMKKPVKNAKAQLFQLIKKLNKDSNFLSDDEFISVLAETKSICANKQLTETLIQSLNMLKDTRIHCKDSLTKREKQVLILIGEGLQNSDIAVSLNLSKSTIETHRKNMRKKLKLKTNVNLFAPALLFSVQYANGNKDDNY